MVYFYPQEILRELSMTASVIVSARMRLITTSCNSLNKTIPVLPPCQKRCDALVVLGCHLVWSNVWALEWALCRSPAWSPAGRCVRDRSTAVVKVLLTEQLCP